MSVKKQYSSRLARGTRPGRVEQEHVARYEFAAQRAAKGWVLDIACGTGYGSRILREKGANRVCGVDVSPDAITFARRNNVVEGIEYICTNAEDVNNLGPFDSIISFETIEHVYDYEKTLKNFYTMLKPGSMLIISTPNRPVTSPNAKTINDKPENDYHVREFDLPEFITGLRKAGFLIKEEDIYGQCVQQIFSNGITHRLHKRFGWFENPRFSADVRPLTELPSLKYMVIIASKPNV